MTFSELNLHESLLQALTAAGYTQPTLVQERAIPAALAGHDLLVSSQTGSGKTAAFMLPALNRLIPQERPQSVAAPQSNDRNAKRPNNKRGSYGKPPMVRLSQPAQPRMLVLTPTRELALQVTEATEKYAGKVRQIRAVAILGGMPYPKQMEMLAKNPEILVATPGRLIDHLDSNKIDLSQLQMLVLDEADRMLDMGFIEDIEKIVAKTPASRQTWLFSATLDGEIGRIARQVTSNAQTIQINSAQMKHENIVQRLHFADDLAHKNRLLDHLLRDDTIDQAIIFTATKRDADTLSDRLNLAGFNVAALHGDMAQGARNRTLNAMRKRQIRILVATDVAARGIDVPTITHVFNYDLPKFAEDYVHRIGRTGRAGRNGQAISLVNHSEGFAVRRIERFTHQAIPVEVIAGHEPVRAAQSRPSNSRRPSGPNAGRKPAPGKSYGKPGYGAKPAYAAKSEHGAKSAHGSKPAPRTFSGSKPAAAKRPARNSSWVG